MNLLLNTGAGWGYEMTPAELTRKDQFLKRKPNDNNVIQIKRRIDICRLVPTIL